MEDKAWLKLEGGGGGGGGGFGGEDATCVPRPESRCCVSAWATSESHSDFLDDTYSLTLRRSVDVNRLNSE